MWIHLEVGYLCDTLSVLSNGLFFNRPWFIYNTEWCRLFFFFNFFWTFLWMHLAVSYLCHNLSVLSNRLVFGSSCQGCLFFLVFFLSVFPFQGAYHHLFWWSCIFRFSSCWFCIVCNLIPISIVPRTLLSSVELMITSFGKAVFSVSLHLDFVWFAIDCYLTCSLYSFTICGLLFSMM